MGKKITSETKRWNDWDLVDVRNKCRKDMLKIIEKVRLKYREKGSIKEQRVCGEIKKEINSL